MATQDYSATHAHRIYRYGQAGEKFGKVAFTFIGAALVYIFTPKTGPPNWWIILSGAFLGYLIGFFIGGIAGRNWARMTNFRERKFADYIQKNKAPDPSLPHKKSSERAMEKLPGKTQEDVEIAKTKAAEKMMAPIEEVLKKKKEAADDLMTMKRIVATAKARKMAIPSKGFAPHPPEGSSGGGLVR